MYLKKVSNFIEHFQAYVVYTELESYKIVKKPKIIH